MEHQDPHERVRICKTLLSLMGYEHLWDSKGPTAQAKKLLDQYGGPMSKSQWILYQVIWYVWGRPAEVKVQEVMQLPAPFGQWAMGLLEATLRGRSAVGAWLSEIEGILSASGKKALKFHRLA